MRLSIFVLLVGFSAIGFAFPVTNQHGRSKEELVNGKEGSSGPDELLNPPSLPPIPDVLEIRVEGEPRDEENERKRLRRNGLTPPAVFTTPDTEEEADTTVGEGDVSERGENVGRVKRNGLNPSYIPPTFGVGPADVEEAVEGSGEARNERAKRNGLNPSYIPPTFGVGPAVEEEVEGSGDVEDIRVKRNGLNPSYIPPTFGVGPAEVEEGAKNERAKRNGLNPSYIPPTFGVGPAVEEEVEGSGDVDDIRVKRNGLNPSYIPPTFGVGPAEVEESGDENGERVKRQILENEGDFVGRGRFTPPPFLPDEEDVLLLRKTLAEHENSGEVKDNSSKHESGAETAKRFKRCSTCSEGKENVGDEGIVESGDAAGHAHDENTSGLFDSSADVEENNEGRELYGRVRRNSGAEEDNGTSDDEKKAAVTVLSQDTDEVPDSQLQDKGIGTIDDVPTAGRTRSRRSIFIEERKSPHPDHWSEDQDKMIEKILRHEIP